MQHLSSKNHVFIIGFGAIGKALAVFLKLAGKKVTVIRGSVQGSETEIRRVRVEMPDQTLREADIEIRTLDAVPTMEGIVVLASKSYGNQQLAISMQGKTGNSPIVLLQNGLGVERPFMEAHFPEIFRCVLFATSQTIDENTVRFKPVAVCPIGVERGSSEQLPEIVRHLTTAELAFQTQWEIQPIIWKKAIVNCVFNSVCPLLEVDNGIFHRDEKVLEIARRVIAECISIAYLKQIALTAAQVEESLLQISRSSDGQLISTLQDMHNNRRTEIDTLNFEMVRLAAELGQSHAVMQTQLLGELIKLKSEKNISQN